jgi:PPOX class probable F420-dependent enzyme
MDDWGTHLPSGATPTKEGPPMDDRVREFLEKNHRAVMVTLRRDGTPHAARVGVGLVDGKLWSSGTKDRVRTGHLRRNNYSLLCVLADYQWLAIEARVKILDGPEAVEQNLALYRVLAGEPDDLDEYRAAMVAERRLIYEFGIERTYGTY